VWYAQARRLALDRVVSQRWYSGHREKIIGVPIYRAQHGGYLIKATAFQLPGGLWQPRLMMTRLAHAGTLEKGQSFPGLSPALHTAKAAARFAADLGRRLADEHSSRLRI
jgi:hypothetical protein